MDENQQLIDFLAEDDYLIDFPFRDSLEDLRLSVTFENKHEQGRFMPSENAENESPRRPSFMRKSLAWDSAFFTSAGVLDPEELVMINKGFKKSDAHDQLPRIREQFENQDLKPDVHKSGTRSKVVQTRNILSSGKTSVFSKEVKPIPTLRSQSLTPRGFEKTAKKTRPQIQKLVANTSGERSSMSSPLPPKISGRPSPISAGRTKRVPSPADLIRMEAKTRKAGSGLDVTVAKKSRLGDLSGLTTTSIRDSTVSCSYESSSNASSSTYSSKSMRNEKSKKPAISSSVHLPLMSNWSSSTSPASSTDGWCLSPAHGLHTPTSESSRVVRNARLASDSGNRFGDLSPACRKSEEANNQVRCSKTALPGTIRKTDVKSSGLRMPSPKIGFFDEATVKGSVFEGHSPLYSFNVSSNEKHQSRFRAAKTSPGFDLDPALGVENRSKTVRKSGRSSSRPEGQRTETAAKNKSRMAQKKRRDDTVCVLGEDISLSKRRQDERNLKLFEDEKENIGSIDDQVVGLSKYLEVIHLENDVVIEVKEKPSFSRPQPQEEKQDICLKPTPEPRTPFAVL